MSIFGFLKQADINAGVQEFLKTEKAVLLDVRTKEEYESGHIENSENIPLQQAKRELFKGFIRTLEKQDGLTHEFDAGIWSSLVQEVIVKAKDDIRFIFKNGFEVRV